MNEAPALQRGIEILHYLSQFGQSSLITLETKLEIPRASLNRLIKCLLENGSIEFDTNRKEYQIGKRLIYHISSCYEKDNVVTATSRLLKKLAEKWHVTFVVYEYIAPFQIMWWAKEEPLGAIKTQPAGFITPKMNINSQGQLFLSYLPDEKIKEFCHKNLSKSTEYTLTTEQAILDRVTQIRRKGYAYQERENNLTMKQLAVPLKIRNSPKTLALGCFLPIDFDDVDSLRDSMIFESSLLINQE